MGKGAGKRTEVEVGRLRGKIFLMFVENVKIGNLHCETQGKKTQVKK